MEIVDAQLHLNLFTIETALAGMDAVGIDAVLVDEFRGYDDERRPITDYRLSERAVAEHPERFGYVVRHRPDDPGLERQIEELRHRPGRLGLRITPYQLHPGSASFAANAELARHDFDAIAGGAYDRYFALAQRFEVPVFLQIAGVEIPPRIAMVERILETFPELQLVVDHLGVTLAADPVSSWERTRAQVADVCALARYPNAALKWGHAPELSAVGYPYPDLLDLLHEYLEAFGAGRIMWASDWMPGTTPHAWADALSYLRATDRLSPSEKEAILGGTVRRLLRWPSG